MFGWTSLHGKGKRGDEGELKGDNLNAIDPYLFQQPSINIDSHPPSLRCSHFIEVPHINQIYTWDCGLACVLMVLKTIGVNNCDIQTLAELCCTTSIWTVDLAYLLQRFAVAFSYFTVTFGANPNYSIESFYKEELPNDLVRVDLLFQKAVEAGIDIQCRSISAEEISILILSGKYIAIVLVDHNKLSHVLQEDVPMPGLFSNNPGYTGISTNTLSATKTFLTLAHKIVPSPPSTMPSNHPCSPALHLTTNKQLRTPQNLPRRKQNR
ncbi:hypothetical protein JHK85_032750 [Glycine max]|nr:hypothetical protein JHK85_032750 [Glycine max]